MAGNWIKFEDMQPPKDIWVVGKKENWDETSSNAPFFVGKLYDLRKNALIDFSKGRWVVCSEWTRLDG